MCVATWGYGTGATTDDAHPFSLTIQGIDVIDWVPLESIKVTVTVTSNGTLEFDIVGNPELPALPIDPFAYADVVLTENSGRETVTRVYQADTFQDDAFDDGLSVLIEPPAIIFSGLIIGFEQVGLAAGEGWRVRAVDYGYLLDKAPMKRGVLVSYPSGVVPPPGDFAVYLYEVVLAIMGQAAAPGITAIAASLNYWWLGANDAGRVLIKRTELEEDRVLGYVFDDAGTGDSFMAGIIRANLDTAAERARLGYYGIWILPGYLVTPIVVWVDPERRLNVHPADTAWGDAPFAIDNDTATGTHTEAMAVDYDFTELASGVFVSDSDLPSGGDNSAFHVSDIAATNGYFICPDSTDAQLASSADVADAGERYLSNASHDIVRGSLVVTQTEQLRPATYLAITDSRFGLDADEVVITSVATEFYPGTSGSRRMTVDFLPTSVAAMVRTQSAQRTIRSGIVNATTTWTVTAP